MLTLSFKPNSSSAVAYFAHSIERTDGIGRAGVMRRYCSIPNLFNSLADRLHVVTRIENASRDRDVTSRIPAPRIHDYIRLWRSPPQLSHVVHWPISATYPSQRLTLGTADLPMYSAPYYLLNTNLHCTSNPHSPVISLPCRHLVKNMAWVYSFHRVWAEAFGPISSINEFSEYDLPELLISRCQHVSFDTRLSP